MGECGIGTELDGGHPDAEEIVHDECDLLVRVEPFFRLVAHVDVDGTEKPYMRVKAITHKGNPIQNTCTVGPSITDIHQVHTLNRSAWMWKQLEDMNITGLQSVYYFPGSTGRFMCVASVDSRKPGHSTQVGTAMVSTKTGEYGLKIAVVDDDINPANMDEVLWALSTRMRPEVGVQILERGWNTPLDPSYVSSNRVVLGGAFTGRLVIDATTPWEWPDEEQGILTELNDDVVEELEGRWSEFFSEPAEATTGATAEALATADLFASATLGPNIPADSRYADPPYTVTYDTSSSVRHPAVTGIIGSLITNS